LSTPTRTISTMPSVLTRFDVADFMTQAHLSVVLS
jgi:hypothetical protein